MTVDLVVSACLALLAALSFAVATVAQQRAAARSSDEDARGLAFLRQLVRRPQWWAGTGGNVFGYGLQAAALGIGSLLVVQPILVTSLLFALPLGARLAHRRLPLTARVWGPVLVVALAVFVGLARPDRGVNRGAASTWALVGLAVLALEAACLLVARARTGPARAALLAVAAGVLEGVLAVLTKTVAATAAHGVVAVLTLPETYALVVVGLAGVYLQQLAFQAGALQASLPIVIVLEPMSAALLGAVLLREQLAASGPVVAGLVGAAGVLAVATVVLARTEAAVLP